MRKWKTKDRDDLGNAEQYKFKDGKVEYNLEYSDSNKTYDMWSMEIQNCSKNQDEQFSVYMMFKVKHGPNYDDRLFKAVETRIKKLLKVVKP